LKAARGLLAVQKSSGLRQRRLARADFSKTLTDFCSDAQVLQGSITGILLWEPPVSRGFDDFV
jgi:hypothetical protein